MRRTCRPKTSCGTRAVPQTGEVIRSGSALLSEPPTEFVEPTKLAAVPKSATFSKDFHIMSRIKTLDKRLKTLPEYNVPPRMDHYERFPPLAPF